MPSFLGLTGNIASGKTTVGLLLLELGAAVYIDADLVVHEMYLPGQPLVPQLIQAFGPNIADAQGGIDRKALGALVFGDPARLRQLESIVHPVVQTEIMRRAFTIPEHGVGILDAVKLIESGYAPLCHGVWIVTSTPEEQVRRMVQNRGLSEAEARARIAAQPPIGPKLDQASEVIQNNGSLTNLRAQVTAAWQRFLASLPPEQA